MTRAAGFGMDGADMRPLQAAGRIHDSTRVESRICWYVYDPAEGDQVEQIPAGTPALPDYWRWPRCDAGQDKFLPLADR